MQDNMIGILTLFYRNYNYGGILQAYALNHFLTQKGFLCEEINYSSSKIATLQKKHIIRKGLKQPFAFLYERIKHWNGRKEYQKKFPERPVQKAFDNFMESEFKQTKLYTDLTISELSSRYRWYIVGGDQVWNPTWSDNSYFFDFVKNGKKISYSCSIGKDNLTENEKKWLLTNLKNLDSIAVREDSANILLCELGFKSIQVPDPIFLLSSKQWRSFAGEQPIIDKPYIFTYLLGEDKKRREQIKLFARKNDCYIVNIPHIGSRINKADIGFADKDINNAGPREFVNLISNANFIFTDSFHGTAFSLLLAKPFRCFSRFSKNDSDSQNSRLFSILRAYEREKYYIKCSEIADENFDLIDAEEKLYRDKCSKRLLEIGSDYLIGTLTI